MLRNRLFMFDVCKDLVIVFILKSSFMKILLNLHGYYLQPNNNLKDLLVTNI